MAESVAGREEINSEAKERKRKPNFSVYKIGVITENVKKNTLKLFSQNQQRMSPKKRNKKSGKKLGELLMQWEQQTVWCPR